METLATVWLAVAVVLTVKCGRTGSEDICIRKQFFVKKDQDALLINHVIAQYQVTSAIDCGHRCTREPRCISFNYEDHSTSLLHLCEISDVTKQNKLNDLIGMEGFSYFELEQPLPCGIGVCYNGGKCMEECDGQTKCICADGYTGTNCERELSTASNAIGTTSPPVPCSTEGSQTPTAIISSSPSGNPPTPAPQPTWGAGTNNGGSTLPTSSAPLTAVGASPSPSSSAPPTSNPAGAESCLALKQAGENSDGLFQIQLRNIGSVQVFCDQQTDGGGWTLIQRRTSPFSQQFDRTWVEYEAGFGNPQGEFWLGNKIIHGLMNTTRTLRIELKTRLFNMFGYAEFSHVTVEGANDKYRMKIWGYKGNISDCGSDSSWQFFTTLDADNDAQPNKNCAVDDNAGWWYKNCGCGNLNRQTGPKWDSWYISNDTIVYSEIKIR